MDRSEITSFNIAKNLPNSSLISPDENHFAITPENLSPANVYRSDDCNEILAKELEQLNEIEKGDRTPDSERGQLVSQSSIEIEICDTDKKDELNSIEEEAESIGEVSGKIENYPTIFKSLQKPQKRCFFFVHRYGLFWIFILACRSSTSIAIHEFVRI